MFSWGALQARIALQASEILALEQQAVVTHKLGAERICLRTSGPRTGAGQVRVTSGTAGRGLIDHGLSFFAARCGPARLAVAERSRCFHPAPAAVMTVWGADRHH